MAISTVIEGEKGRIKTRSITETAFYILYPAHNGNTAPEEIGRKESPCSSDCSVCVLSNWWR